MWNVRLRIALLIFLILIPFAAKNSHNVLALNETEEDAKTAIEDAQENLIDCYTAAVDAEKSGANITELLSVLNEAGMFLSKASFAYSEGNFSSAVYFANLTRTNLEGFVDWAQALKEKGIREINQDFMVNIVGSISGSLAILCGGFAVFFLFKRREGKAEGVAA
ncbi:hypothetical protein HXY33_07220 [Candidatus Bathyarchaeota archaeon]|nr:hypothetical protein [Candidatus Bathyarchaeota archaeon]